MTTATVRPWEIQLPDELPSNREVRRQMWRLIALGQIEPLVGTVNSHGTWTVDNSDWSAASAQVWAARLLRQGVRPDDEKLVFVRTPDAPNMDVWWTLMVTDETESL